MALPSRRPILAAFAFLSLLGLTAAVAFAAGRFQRTPEDPRRILLNDMREAAGTVVDGTLSVHLEAREGDWYPDGPDGPAIRVAAFAEAGRPLRNPGPLLRIPAGTEVRATVRNELAVPLTMYGLGERRGLEADSVRIEPGATHEFRFAATEPGLYYYAGRTMDVPHVLERFEDDSQLNGALVVDPPGTAGRARDRLFMITGWATLDSTRVSGLGPNPVLAINGAMWPHTERFDVAQGDSLHWRWLNPTIIPHPMHLHGFYFRLEARGDGASYANLPPEGQRLAVTEILPPGGTMAIAWQAERPGNWIFHCHFAGHMSPETALEQDRRHPETILAADHAASPAAGHTSPPAADHGADPPALHLASAASDRGTASPATHGVHAMSGLVLGIRVKPRGRQPAAGDEARHIRLLLRSKPQVYGEYAGYGFVLGGSAEERSPDALTVPGPLLLLEKGRRVAVTLVNQTHEPAAVHWHGIELESFPDGVPGWSGSGKSVLPAVPPRDSLTVRFTPPRAGTFIYHSHFNELQQIGSGMYGPLIVVEPGAVLDPETDRMLLFSDGGPLLNVVAGPFPPLLLNGEERPGPIELRAGVRYRFRLIMIGAESMVELAVRDGDRPVTWRTVAKDGADLQPVQVTSGPAHLVMAAGETYDVELTPERSGPLTLSFGVPQFVPGAPPPVEVPVIVR